MADAASTSSESGHEELRGGSGCRHHRPAGPERPLRSLSDGPHLFVSEDGSDRDTTGDAERRVLVDVHSRPDGVTPRCSVALQGETARDATWSDGVTSRGTVVGQNEIAYSATRINGTVRRSAVAHQGETASSASGKYGAAHQGPVAHQGETALEDTRRINGLSDKHVGRREQSWQHRRPTSESTVYYDDRQRGPVSHARYYVNDGGRCGGSQIYYNVAGSSHHLTVLLTTNLDVVLIFLKVVNNRSNLIYSTPSKRGLKTDNPHTFFKQSAILEKKRLFCVFEPPLGA